MHEIEHFSPHRALRRARLQRRVASEIARHPSVIVFLLSCHSNFLRRASRRTTAITLDAIAHATNPSTIAASTIDLVGNVVTSIPVIDDGLIVVDFARLRGSGFGVRRDTIA